MFCFLVFWALHSGAKGPVPEPDDPGFLRVAKGLVRRRTARRRSTWHQMVLKWYFVPALWSEGARPRAGPPGAEFCV